MNDPAELLGRLDAIGASLASEPTALALLGLGSVGAESDRLDRYSDLDFFVIVDSGSKPGYLDDLTWMERVAPIGFAFRNTPDGHKVLFEDGVFCEYAVFEPAELSNIEFTGPRIVWQAVRFDPALATPTRSVEDRHRRPAGDLIDDALTNLYVGLLREHRGERMAAFRMIQGHAVDRVLELVELADPNPDVHVDPFGDERRFEFRHPMHAGMLEKVTPGYANNLDAAAAILEVLPRFGPINTALTREIRMLLETRS